MLVTIAMYTASQEAPQPVDAGQTWLDSVSNDNDRYRYTVAVPRERQGRWWALLLDGQLHPATEENEGDRANERHVSFYLDRQLADRVAALSGTSRLDRQPIRDGQVRWAVPERIVAGQAALVSLQLANRGAQRPLGVSLGDPDGEGRDHRFTVQIWREGELLPPIAKGGSSGRPVELAVGQSTSVQTDLTLWGELVPGTYEVEVSYALELYRPQERWGVAHRHLFWNDRPAVSFVVEVSP